MDPYLEQFPRPRCPIKPADLGTGILNWDSRERTTDRYGSVTLSEDLPDLGHDYLRLQQALKYVDCLGQLIVTVVEPRQSPHIGDFARGLFPPRQGQRHYPTVGLSLPLGRGRLFVEQTTFRHWAVGLRPVDGRAKDWLDPQVLYRVHGSLCTLTFEVV